MNLSLSFICYISTIRYTLFCSFWFLRPVSSHSAVQSVSNKPMCNCHNKLTYHNIQFVHSFILCLLSACYSHSIALCVRCCFGAILNDDDAMTTTTTRSNRLHGLIVRLQLYFIQLCPLICHLFSAHYHHFSQLTMCSLYHHHHHHCHNQAITTTTTTAWCPRDN